MPDNEQYQVNLTDLLHPKETFKQIRPPPL